MDENKKIIWEGSGCSFGAKIPGSKYILYCDSIYVTTGVFFKREQSTPLYQIMAKEVCSSMLSRLFNCGSIILITRGKELPNIILSVKDPRKVLDIINKAEYEERHSYRKEQEKTRKDLNNNAMDTKRPC